MLKNFFIKCGIYILVFFQVTGIILMSVFTRRFWKKVFSKNKKTAKIGLPIGERPSQQFNPSEIERVYQLTVYNIAKPDPKKKIHEQSKKAVLFGFNQFFASVNFGNPPEIELKGNATTYAEIIAQSAHAPFVVSGMRIVSENREQLGEALIIQKRDANGQTVRMPLHPLMYLSALQFQSQIIEIFPYNITIDGQTQIHFDMLPDTSITFMFFVGRQINISDQLRDTSPTTNQRFATIIRSSGITQPANQKLVKSTKELFGEKIIWYKMRWLDDGIESLKSKKNNNLGENEDRTFMA